MCIYFPAVKEDSGLKFHLHAPFASTVARDSVRDDPENAQLVADIGRLIVYNLPALRDGGLISDTLLAALPNEDDPLQAPYTSIRDIVIEAFNKESLTPVRGRSGYYAPGGEPHLESQRVQALPRRGRPEDTAVHPRRCRP